MFQENEKSEAATFVIQEYTKLSLISQGKVQSKEIFLNKGLKKQKKNIGIKFADWIL